MDFIGESAALTTALCWAFTSVFFAEAGRRIGSFEVNKIRLLIAVSIYVVVLLVTTGRLFPEETNWQHVFWLGLSGFLGLVIGDGAGFKAMVMIGPRLMTLLHSTAPVMATIIAWLFLGEKLGSWSLLGIAITVAGVTWVVSERKYHANNNKNQVDQSHPDAGSLTKGVLLGLVAAFGQASGLVLAKHAMFNAGAQLEPMDASFIRMFTAMLIIWAISAFRGQTKETLKAFKNGKAVLYSFAGAVFGPFIGVWMSLVAVAHIAAGVAATLNSTTPIWVIPVLRILYREKVSWRALLGAAVTVTGVALLILS